jgi:hypothetical protein
MTQIRERNGFRRLLRTPARYCRSILTRRRTQLRKYAFQGQMTQDYEITSQGTAICNEVMMDGWSVDIIRTRRSFELRNRLPREAGETGPL